MSFTKLDVINLALINIGSQPINSLDDDKKNINLIRFYYDIVKQGELRAYNWNFAITRAKLAALSTDAITDYSILHQFPVPTDFLKLLFVDAWAGQFNYIPDYYGNGYNTSYYRLEGNNIVTYSSSPLFIKYIKNVDETNFDPLFVDVLACALSIKISDGLVQNTQKLQASYQMYQAAIQKALRANAFEIPRQVIPDNSFVLSRF